MAELIQGWLHTPRVDFDVFLLLSEAPRRSDISHNKERQEVGRLRDQQLQEILMRMSRGMQLDNSHAQPNTSLTYLQ